MNILFSTFELAPFTKVGGLADVMGSMPKALRKLGCNIKIFAPFIGSINQEKYGIKEVPGSEMSIRFGQAMYTFTLRTTKLPDTDIDVYFIENYKYFGCTHEVYPKNIDHRYEQERFVCFSLACLEYAKKLNYKPDIFHVNDWHTAMIPIYLKNSYRYDSFYQNTKCVLSIHNLAYQGQYNYDILNFANMYVCDVFHSYGCEHFGSLNWLKGAINYTDKIVAVSPKYAEEILTAEYGEGMDYTLRCNQGKIRGILNGIDYSVFDPAKDKSIVKNYTVKNFEKGKAECKKELCKEFNLPYYPEKPVIGFVSRLVDQKGLDLFYAAEQELRNMDAQLIILGSGEKRYEDYLDWLCKTSDNIRVYIGYNGKLANKIYSGADMFLMPSKFEPCGLSQLVALKYGTLPIVRATGGLDNTIVGYPLDNSNGFKFWRYDSWDMMQAIYCATGVYHDKHTRNAMIKSAMEYDYSWDKSAKEYYQMYKDLCGKA